MTTPRTAPARREQAAATALCLLSSALALLAAGRTWATGVLEPRPPLPAREVSLLASQAGSSVRGLAVVGLAGAVAVVAARGWGRVLVGVVLLVTGLGIVLDAVSFDAAGAFGDALLETDTATSTGWPLLAGVGGAGLALSGAFVVARGRRWSSLSSRYDAPRSARPSAGPAPTGPPAVAEPAAGERELWEALDRGTDPTASPPPPGPPPPGRPPPGDPGDR
jgi:uncharacterized membrane protein (TIGR02234 family)